MFFVDIPNVYNAVITAISLYILNIWFENSLNSSSLLSTVTIIFWFLKSIVLIAISAVGDLKSQFGQ